MTSKKVRLLYSVYVDHYGMKWLLQEHRLPKRKGEWIFWLAECIDDKNLSFRDETKKNVLWMIANRHTFLPELKDTPKIISTN